MFTLNEEFHVTFPYGIRVCGNRSSLGSENTLTISGALNQTHAVSQSNQTNERFFLPSEVLKRVWLWGFEERHASYST